MDAGGEDSRQPDGEGVHPHILVNENPLSGLFYTGNHYLKFCPVIHWKTHCNFYFCFLQYDITKSVHYIIQYKFSLSLYDLCIAYQLFSDINSVSNIGQYPKVLRSIHAQYTYKQHYQRC